MNRVTLASIAFLLFAIAVSAWLLMRPRAPVDDASLGGANPGDIPAGLTFAEWSVRNDGVLLADIDPGSGASTLPRRFMYLPVKRSLDGVIQVEPGRSFSWAAADRKDSAEALFALGFRVNPEGRAYNPPDDPFFSDPVAKGDAGPVQVVTLREKAGAGGGATRKSVRFERRSSDPHTIPYWGRRAIGFPSSDGHMLYVTPDAIVVSSDAPSPTP